MSSDTLPVAISTLLARQAVQIPVPKAITGLIAEFERAGKGGVLAGVA